MIRRKASDLSALPRVAAKTAKDAITSLEKALLTRDEWLRLAAQGSELGLWYWNEITQGLFWDRKTREIFGVNLDGDVTLETFYKTLHPEDLTRVQSVWRHQLENGIPYELEYRAQRPDGSIRWINARGSGYHDTSGKPRYMIGVIFDVTERKNNEQQRAELSGRLIRAQEQDRSRLARELHDDVSQRLALVLVALGRTFEIVKDSEVSERVLDLVKTVDEIANDVRLLAHRLYSSKLEILGLVQTLASFCRDFSRDHGIPVNFDCPDILKPISPESALCIYRLVQEGLHNVDKHSQATSVEIRLKGNRGELCLTLSDDGVGFDLARNYTSNGIGIQSMNERVRLLGGRFEIQSRPSVDGTKIVATVPLGGIGAEAGLL